MLSWSLRLASPPQALVAGNGRGEAEERTASAGRNRPANAPHLTGDEGEDSAFLPQRGKRKAEALLRASAHSQIGSGEWNRTIDLQVMSLMSYHCSTPRHVKHNILRKEAFVKTRARDFRAPAPRMAQILTYFIIRGLANVGLRG